MKRREAICMNCGHIYIQEQFAPGKWTKPLCPKCGDGNTYRRIAKPEGGYRPGKRVGDGSTTQPQLDYVGQLREPQGRP